MQPSPPSTATTGKRALASRIPTRESIAIIGANQVISLAYNYRNPIPAIHCEIVSKRARLYTAEDNNTRRLAPNDRHQHGRTAFPPPAYARNLNLLTPEQLGRLAHYTFDAVLVSAFLAGVKRSTGLTYVSLLIQLSLHPPRELSAEHISLFLAVAHGMHPISPHIHTPPCLHVPLPQILLQCERLTLTPKT